MRERFRYYINKVSLKEEKTLLEQVALRVHSACKKIKSKLVKNNNPIISKIYLASKRVDRSLFARNIKFVTIDDLVVWTSDFIKTFPTTFDLIIGVPRSGLLVANIIGLRLGKPVTTPELFNNGVLWKSNKIESRKTENILLVDDSVRSGKSIDEAKNVLLSSNKEIKLFTAALITTNFSKNLVDFHYKIIEYPRVFEWNLLHTKQGLVVSDMDGVICENCPPGIDANEELYIEWLRNAKPYLIPAFEIDVILSNRLKKYRPETEEWLTKYGVRYKELILWDLENKNQRLRNHANNKVKSILEIKPEIIWESSLWEANEIWEKTKIPTLCVDEMIFFN